MYRLLLRPLLFLLPAETAHRLVLGSLALLMRLPGLLRALRRWLGAGDPRLVVEAFGLRFDTPIGLAAGLDKDGEAFEVFGALGFAFVEVGTVTAHGQPGNPRPRLFRLRRDRALINRMGFNNHGAAALAERVASVGRRDTRLGINIGKTKLVSNDAALDDYAASAALVAAHADYVAINVSSPNTAGLRDLQQVDALRPLAARVRDALDAAQPKRRVPLLLKIAPDLSDADIDAIADLALELGLDGIIATNTTVSRDGLSTPVDRVLACGIGGLSGAPLKPRALAVLRRLRARLGNRVVLISVGGIETAEDAWARIRAGASLVQLYTAVIYEGPGLPRRIARGLADLASQAGYPRVADAIGVEIDR